MLSKNWAEWSDELTRTAQNQAECETQLTVLSLCPNIRRTKVAPERSIFTIAERESSPSFAVCQSLNGCAAHSSRRLLTLGLKTCYVLTPFTRRCRCKKQMAGEYRRAHRYSASAQRHTPHLYTGFGP
jgi:hypothetical protein